ncbi:putative lipoprotein YiaD precursor [bacterium BMS3Abin03]|nr:putative lipoprotein YiaD precursor [bacterium BMS3Abin03]
MFIFSLNIFAQKTSGKNNEGLLLDLSFNNSFIDNSNTVPGIKPNNVKLIKDRYGKENSAAGFKEADSYINIPLNINPDKQPVITIILWAKIDDMRNKMAILSQDNGDYDRSVYVVDRRGAMFCGKDERVLTGSQVAAGSWFFIAAVYNQSTADILLFVNGNVFKRKAKTGQGLNYFYIGANPSFGDSFSGAIDDVRIYDRALNKTEIQKVFEEESKDVKTEPGVLQYFYSDKGKDADIKIRVGDIDNLGFGWAVNFDPFCGNNTPSHPYPWQPNENDYAGTDRIIVGSGCVKEDMKLDGYSKYTNRPENNPVPIKISFPKPAIKINSVVLQMLIDDFQAPKFGSSFQFSIDGKRISYIEKILNSVNQTGPVGKLVTFGILPEDINLFEDGRIEIMIDDPFTGIGDGFALDFVQILINPHQEYTCTGNIKGIVKNEQGNLLDSVLVSNSALQELLTNKNGEFALNSVPSGLANVTAQKSGYESKSLMFDLKRDETKDVVIILKKKSKEDKDFINNELKKNGTINLYGIHFETNKTQPMPNSKSTLEALLNVLKSDPKLKIIIVGHTDSDGSSGFNQKLSEQRAKAIRSWLIKNDIAKNRMLFKGMGETSPIAGNKTANGKALNRRVEIIVR